jgi:aspartate kinase
MIVMKFGGSSVESAAAIDRVASIVESRLKRRPVVVVSAMGRTTNRLDSIARVAASGDREGALAQVAALEQDHLKETAGYPALEPALRAHFAEIAELVRGLAVLGELTARSIDTIWSYGERISSLVVTEMFRKRGIDAVHQDSREYIITDERHTQAAPQTAETYQRLAAKLPPLAAERVVVMGGFIASTRAGVPSTLGRGGSDFTAALVGAGIGAEEIQIWTDVDGILTCDPRILPGGHRVKAISFAEAAELAYFGAKVLHPATVQPAIEKNIPVLVLNSRRPDSAGTRIVADRVPCANPIKAIACKQNITSVHIRSTRMLMAHGYLRRIFEIFDRFETPVDMVATSEVSVSLTIDDPRRLDRIAAELHEFSEVSVEEGQAIVCLVGDNIGFTHGIAGRVFQSLNGTNIRIISQGASLLNLSFVVAGKDLAAAVDSLHREFFAELDPAVFERTA